MNTKKRAILVTVICFNLAAALTLWHWFEFLCRGYGVSPFPSILVPLAYLMGCALLMIRTGPFAVTLCRIVLAAVSVLFITVAAVTIFYRITYPFELEWLESMHLDDVRWLLSGHKLYGPPSLEFTSPIYTPLYFYMGALVSQWTSAGLFPLRLISLASSAVVLLFVYLIVRREIRSRWLALMSAGFFAATFNISGAWFDLARVDMLFMALLMPAVYLLRFHPSVKTYTVAAVLVWLSFLAKQAALGIILPLALFFLYKRCKERVVFSVLFAGLTGMSVFLLDHYHDGWFLFNTFYVPSMHPFLPEVLFRFWTHDLFLTVPLAVLSAFYFLINAFSGTKKESGLFYVFLALGAVLSSWLHRLHWGGFNNVLIPIYTLLAILLALGVHSLIASIKSVFDTRPFILRRLTVLVLTACAAQFVLLSYNPVRFIPTDADLSAGNALLSQIKQMEGDVFIPYHTNFLWMANKPPHAHQMALYDVLRTRNPEIGAGLRSELTQAVRAKRFSAMVLDERKLLAGLLPDSFEEDFQQNYVEKIHPIFQSPSVFRPVSGEKFRPEKLLLAKKITQASSQELSPADTQQTPAL